jgi:hypothetical protein
MYVIVYSYKYSCTELKKPKRTTNLQSQGTKKRAGFTSNLAIQERVRELLID